MSNRDKPLLAALRGETAARPPFWLMRQAGRYLPEYRALRHRAGSFLELCLASELAAEVTLQPLRRFGMDGAILFSDILIVPWALGQPLEFREGEGPVLDPAALGALGRARFDERIAPILETVRLVARDLPPKAALIGFAGSPWTVATYMVEGRGGREGAAARLLAFRDPARFGALIDLLVDATTDYLAGQVEAGAEAVQLFDSWSGLLTEQGFADWVIAPTRTIATRLRARFPGVPIIGFPRGAGMLVERYAAETGVSAVALDTAVPLRLARKRLRLPLQGNLDPLALVAGGAALERGIDDILDAMSGAPFVFNLGHGIVPETPPEHVAALAERIRRGA